MSHSIAFNQYNGLTTTALNPGSDIANIDLGFHVKDPMSALTHFAGCIAAIIFTPVILIHASVMGADFISLIALSIFMLSMITLYGSSASYHTFNLRGLARLRLKRLDHMMIFVLIAGSYTPICLITLRGLKAGRGMLIAVWTIAAIGMLFKLFWVTCPKWVSSIIYIAMGWIVIFAMPTLISYINPSSLKWLYIGGVTYTIGGVIYALKLIKFNNRDSLWGSHEIFHLFVLGGSVCHFFCMYKLF